MAVLMHGNRVVVTEEDLRPQRTWVDAVAEIQAERLEQFHADMGTEFRYGPGTWLH